VQVYLEKCKPCVNYFQGGLDTSPSLFNEPEIDDMEYSLLETYLYDPPALHIRQYVLSTFFHDLFSASRTLDGYYYHMLPSTAYRDKTQVVSRYAKEYYPMRHYYYGPWGSSHNILMVGQLWLWKFTKNKIEYVVSCFPDRIGVDETRDDNLRELVLNS
jgi:hypothetical protein